MINEIYNKLCELGVEVLWMERPKNFPTLTFTLINESGEIFADDKEVETEYLVQVDVWSENDYTELVQQVKEKMREIEYHRLSAYDEYEKDTQIYHKILRFTRLKNNEE